MGNKVTWGSDKLRYSEELQSRFVQDFQAVDRWYFEGVATNMYSKSWEIVPDFRLMMLDKHIYKELKTFHKIMLFISATSIPKTR